MRFPRNLATAIAALLALTHPTHADPAADMTLLFSNLCVESRLSVAEFVRTFTEAAPGQPPLEELVSEREQIYVRDIKLGDTDITLQAVAAASGATFRTCRVTAQFPTAEEVEIQLNRMFPEARRTEAVARRLPVGDGHLISVTMQWIAPRPGVAVIDATVEVFGKRRKAILTAVPTP